MLKKSLFSPAQPRRAETHLSPSGVLASLTGTVKRRSAEELRPCLGQGASLGEEAVLADSGLAGEARDA